MYDRFMDFTEDALILVLALTFWCFLLGIVAVVIASLFGIGQVMILAWISFGVSLTLGAALIASLYIRNKNLFIFNRTQTAEAIFVCVCIFCFSLVLIGYGA